MPVVKKEFYKNVKGPWMNDEDWWRLVYDADEYRLYIEHEWSYVNIRKAAAAASDSGVEHLDINEFLASKSSSNARHGFHSVIMRLFEDK